MAQIIPINKLKNTSEISKLCHECDEPVYVTKNGYGDMVIMSKKSYDELTKRIEMYQQLLCAEEEYKAGKTIDAWQALKELKKKYVL